MQKAEQMPDEINCLEADFERVEMDGRPAPTSARIPQMQLTDVIAGLRMWDSSHATTSTSCTAPSEILGTRSVKPVEAGEAHFYTQSGRRVQRPVKYGKMVEVVAESDDEQEVEDKPLRYLKISLRPLLDTWKPKNQLRHERLLRGIKSRKQTKKNGPGNKRPEYRNLKYKPQKPKIKIGSAPIDRNEGLKVERSQGRAIVEATTNSSGTTILEKPEAPGITKDKHASDGTTKVVSGSTSILPKTQRQSGNQQSLFKGSDQGGTASVQHVQQNIQIRRGPDGKLQVRGLMPGQKLVQMPDGKVHLLNMVQGFTANAAQSTEANSTTTTQVKPVNSTGTANRVTSSSDAGNKANSAKVATSTAQQVQTSQESQAQPKGTQPG